MVTLQRKDMVCAAARKVADYRQARGAPVAGLRASERGPSQRAAHDGQRVRVEVGQPVVAQVAGRLRAEQRAVQPRLHRRRRLAGPRLCHPVQHPLRQSVIERAEVSSERLQCLTGPC